MDSLKSEDDGYKERNKDLIEKLAEIQRRYEQKLDNQEDDIQRLKEEVKI